MFFSCKGKGVFELRGGVHFCEDCKGCGFVEDAKCRSCQGVGRVYTSGYVLSIILNVNTFSYTQKLMHSNEVPSITCGIPHNSVILNTLKGGVLAKYY